MFTAIGGAFSYSKNNDRNTTISNSLSQNETNNKLDDNSIISKLKSASKGQVDVPTALGICIIKLHIKILIFLTLILFLC
jgi:hypothetical protein